MARFSRIQVVLAMKETGMVPVFYNPDPGICKKVIKACYDGGVRVFEFTNRGDFAHEIFSEINKYAIREFPDLIMGAGSVIDPGTTSLYIQLGANFIVSPLLNEEMAKICNRRKISWSPGCGSASEISRAEELGAEVVKIFPGSEVGGPKFVSALLGPMPWSSIMPTGGVEPTAENLGAWFKAGVYCVGMGSKLITKEIIKNSDYTLLTGKVKDAIKIINSVRSKK
jgi:2-dehydro-3-deoxyphosphogluconate aldolase/(4S)-4-hydroxy-2-oxoglutarate aldolase